MLIVILANKTLYDIYVNIDCIELIMYSEY